MYPEDITDCQKIYLSANVHQEKFQRQYRLLDGNGEYGWILDNAAPRFTEDGKFIGYVGYCVDITKIKYDNSHLKTAYASLELVQKKPV